jgi:hypothetical protein
VPPVNARMPRRACAVGACCLAAVVAAPAAQAQDADVRPGKNMSVFANSGFVAAFNYTFGASMSVELVREGHIVSRASGPAVATADGPGLEVNHGPLGAPLPGDCWSNYTPRILPGDEVRVTGDGGTDSVLVDEIRVTSADQAGNDVVVKGTAFYADGTPIPLAALDSGEARNIGPVVRANPTSLVAGPNPGEWVATYAEAQGYGVIPGKGDNEDPAVQLRQILKGDHSMGYGHAALPNGAAAPVAQLADGIGDHSGPAPGCEVVAPIVPANAITTLNDDVVNIDSGDLEIGGVSDAGTDVAVTLDDGHGGTVTVDAVEGRRSGAWSALVPRAQLGGLADGTLTVAASFGGDTLSLAKDTAAPAAIGGTPAPGTYATAQSVRLSSGDATDVIRFTRDGTTPTATSPRASGAISIPTTQTIKAFATDAAGNAGPLQTLTYTIGVTAGGGPSSAGNGQTTTAPGLGSVVTVPAGLAAPTRSKPYLRQFGTSPRVKRSAVRKAGIRVFMRVADDAEVVRIRVFRRLAEGKRVLVATAFRSPGRAGLYRTRLANPKLRRDLRVGSYDVEATPGASRSELGTSSGFGLKVIKG